MCCVSSIYYFGCCRHAGGSLSAGSLARSNSPKSSSVQCVLHSKRGSLNPFAPEGIHYRSEWRKEPRSNRKCPRHGVVFAVACKCVSVRPHPPRVHHQTEVAALFWVCFGAHTHTHTTPSSPSLHTHVQPPCLLCLSSWSFFLSSFGAELQQIQFSLRVIEAQVENTKKNLRFGFFSENTTIVRD